MKKLAHLVIACGVLLVAPAYAESLDTLVGCYAKKQDGNPEIRVKKRDGKYYLSIAADWKEEALGHEPTDQEVENIFADQAAFYEAGLYSGMLGIFKVRSGITVKNRPISGKYIAAVLFDAGEVYRVSCP